MSQVGKTQQLRQISHDEFVGLVVRHERRLRAFIATLLARTDDIDDVVQSASMVAWKKVDSFSYAKATPDDEFIRWLCTIARYEALALRRKSGASSLVFDEALIDRLAAIQIEESSYLEDRHKALLGCVQKLRSRDRDMTKQFYEESVSVPELAAAFGVGVNAVYKSLTRIRATLLECVRRAMRREECL